MAIYVRLSTTLRTHVPNYESHKGLELTEPTPLTALELAKRLSLPPEDIKIVMINGRRRTLDDLIQDDDRVGFFPAVGGGLR
jgi:molybdopterin converting factor small subunit